jgi:GNAT superfamily N-acetyltransferase
LLRGEILEASIVIEPASYSAIEMLRGGRKVEIRAQRPRDRDGLTSAVARASKESLYRRFFAVKREFSEKEVSFFVDVDFVNHVALVAVTKEGGQGAIVGGGRYVVVRPGQAEVAFVVIDEYQGQGIGAALMPPSCSHRAPFGSGRTDRGGLVRKCRHAESV